jgi:hypothetical protein
MQQQRGIKSKIKKHLVNIFVYGSKNKKVSMFVLLVRFRHLCTFKV